MVITLAKFVEILSLLSNIKLMEARKMLPFQVSEQKWKNH